jgi:4-aminobutyrate aminotransferase/(S)-3-amino-2-methylpropionate transaminase
MKERRIVKISTQIPGPRSRDVYNLINLNVPKGIFHITPIAVSSAKNATITDLDGNVFLDFTSGIGVVNVGHCADEVVMAIKEQADRYLHTCFHVVTCEHYVRLAGKLNDIAPGRSRKKTLLLNSGAEAVENAVKIARYYTKRHGMLSFMRGFHGRTNLALALTGQVQPYKRGFGPFVPEVYHLPYAYCYRCSFGREYPDCEMTCTKAIEEVFKTVVSPDEVAGLIIEPVLGEGGYVVPPMEFMKKIENICKERGVIFIVDEIQTGFGRTGKMFASEHFNLDPDIMVTAKSLGGGTVLSAVTGRSEVMDAPDTGGLGGTYGGNPLSCRASLAAIELIERDNLAGRAVAVGEKLRRGLLDIQEKYPIIGDVRGLGAMVAVELVKDRETKTPAPQETRMVLETCYKNGLILLGAGADHNVLRAPIPLVITDEEIEEGLSILDEAFKSLMK